jgi:predicted transposase YbfD/YdcC
VDTKANESTAIPDLLDLWALNGGSVTMDAMGGQRTIAQKIGDQGADDVLALKGNPPTREPHRSQLKMQVTDFPHESIRFV